MADPAFTPQRVALLARLVNEPTESWYALGLAQAAGVRSSTVYDALKIWLEHGWIEFSWEDIDPVAEGRPKRKVYRFAGGGAVRAASALEAFGQEMDRARRGRFEPRVHAPLPGWSS